MSEKESKKLVAEAKLEESIGSWLMVGAVHSDECTKKCGASNIFIIKEDFAYSNADFQNMKEP